MTSPKQSVNPTVSIEEEPLLYANQDEWTNDPFQGDIFAFPESDETNRWSVSWADLMMTMFIFFVILYVYQEKNLEITLGLGPGGNYISGEETHKLLESNGKTPPSSVYKNSRQVMKDEFVDNTSRINLVTDQTAGISLAGDILFGVGKADLEPKSIWRLKQIAAFLHNNNFLVNVVGHTDDHLSHSIKYPSNWELSTARACAVTRYLIEKQGLDESRFFVSGSSWQFPLVPNDSLHNRSLNRRVEIILMKQVPYSRISSKNSDKYRN